jgi:FAD/FMN-containing dehydrogenase/Fe-S oxidoreductase
MTALPIVPAPAQTGADVRSLNLAGLRRALATEITGEIRSDMVSRALYSTDASVYQIEPIGVVIPRSRTDLIRLVTICAEFRCPITMRGGGTSQAGQAIGPGLIVDTSKHLTSILDLNVAERWARVEPGLVLDELNAQLRPHGLRFAPDVSTASRATIGGMMANNSSGARSVLYGKTIDHVLEQEVVLSNGSVVHFGAVDGETLAHKRAERSLEGDCYRVVSDLAERYRHEIERRFPRVLRRVGGYNLDEFVKPDRPFNLAKLMVGSEGTLGVVLSAKVNLVPLPKAKAVMAIQFASLLESLAATPLILRHGPSAVEVMDKSILDYTRQSAVLEGLRRSFIDGDPASLLCVEFYADRAEDLPPRLAALERDLREHRFGYAYHHALDLAGQARIWSLREAGLGLSMAMKEDAKSLSFVEDTAVAPERLRDYIERFLAIVQGHGTTAGVYAHASVGCLHVRPVINMKTEDGVRRFEAIANDVSDLVLEFGGALSGEHGDGLVRSPFMEKMFGSDIYGAFRAIKQTFDPHGIFNPGKIVDAPPLTANLRFGPSYVTRSLPTYFEYPEGSFAGAVEMCSGLGACRKTLEGTMCPSYMATREEQHATRGRANVLRLTIAGRLGEAGLGDTGVYDTLDLCLECRACKAECPVGVDVARFKSEFLADYWQRHGTPLHARALGRARRAAEWGSRFAPLSNWILNSPLGRRINEHVLGIDQRRALPEFKKHTLAHAVRNRAVATPDVLLFNDTFTNHYDPEIGLAALDVLSAAGFRPAVAKNRCCGRPQISKGLLGDARAMAARNTDLLLADAEAGRPLVFCEPSCLSAVREDAPALLRGDARRKAEAVAKQSVLFEEFLAARTARLALTPGPKSILLHGHCHQKSMSLVGPAKALLSTIPNTSVVDLDAGCCGMAGSFGYAREHYDVSRAIGERKLFPAVRQKPNGAVVVAAGTSCRHQIADFTGERAVHPAVLIAALLEKADA